MRKKPREINRDDMYAMIVKGRKLVWSMPHERSDYKVWLTETISKNARDVTYEPSQWGRTLIGTRN